jgi:hypothetical protein
MTKIPVVVSRLRKTAIEIKASDGGAEVRKWFSFAETSKFFVGMKMFFYICENDEELHTAEADANSPETAKIAKYSLFFRKGWKEGVDDEKWAALSKFIDYEAARGKPLKTKDLTEFLGESPSK